MTRKNLEANVAAESERADQALQAAAQLLASGLFYDAASRAYYAAFHYARALALAAGEEPKSHQGVAHLLSLHYVRTGRLPPEISRLYAMLQRFRESSDYDSAFVLDEAGAREALDHARRLVSEMRSQLAREGLLKT